jgi:outer membrane protein assembly factor BamB
MGRHDPAGAETGDAEGVMRCYVESMRMTTARQIGIVLGLIASLAAGDESEKNWPRFRGPAGLGVSAGQVVPVELGKETLAWSVPLPGSGSSSPVVWGDSLFVTSEKRDGGEVILVCLDAKSGKSRWSKAVKSGKYRTHKMNNAAAASPCVSADAVAFTWFDSARNVMMLSAWSHDGGKLWDHEVGGFKGTHGPNLQAVIHERRVLYAHLHQKEGHVGAVDVRSGKLLWKNGHPGAGRKTSYVTPLVRERRSKEGPRKEVVVASTQTGVIAIDFESGEQTWSLPGVFEERCIVSPVDILAGSGADDSLLTVGCKKNVFFAVRPPDVNDGKAEVAWRLEKGAPYVPTPVSDGKTLYSISDGGVLQAVDPLSGEQIWQEKLAGNFYASPLLIGGKLYCLSRDGEMFVAGVGAEFKLLATSDLKPGEEVTWTDATPAVAHDSLYVRIGARLDCYRRVGR